MLNPILETQYALSQKGDSTSSKTTNIAAAAISFKTAVGIGLMTIPIHFAHSGYIMGTFIALLFTFMIIYTLVIYMKLIDSIERKHGTGVIQAPEDVSLFIFKNPITLTFFYFCMYFIFNL